MIPAQLTILDEIGARLALVKTGNGYSATIKKITRGRLKPFIAGDIPAVNYWPLNDKVIRKEYGKNLHELPVMIELHDKTRDEPFTDTAANRGADIQTALFRATTAPTVTDIESVSLGGLVNDFILTDQSPMIGEGQSPWFGVIIECTVQYYANAWDAYTIVNL